MIVKRYFYVKISNIREIAKLKILNVLKNSDKNFYSITASDEVDENEKKTLKQCQETK